MANYKEIQGFPIQNLSSDPVPYAQELTNNPYAGVWSSGGALNTARFYVVGSGNASNAIVAGGGTPTIVASVEQYDGSAWTETTDLNTARYTGAASNSSPYTDSVVFAGSTATADTGVTEVWNGSSWTEVSDLNTARRTTGGFGAVSTNALCCGGKTPAPYPGSVNSAVESWNGSSWTEVAEFSTGRNESPQGAGTNTAGLLYGGQYPPGINVRANTESWDGSSWTEVNDLNTGRAYSGAGGSQTSALMYGGRTDGTTDVTNTESWNGTSWTEVNDLAQARYAGSGSSSTGADSAIYSGGGNSSSPPIYANTEEWTFSGLPPSTPAAGYADAITGQMYYNSTTGQFKAIKTGGAPIGTWASGGAFPSAQVQLGAGAGTQTAALSVAGYSPPSSSPFTGAFAGVFKYDGTSWSSHPNNYPTTVYGIWGSGTQTAGLFTGGAAPGNIATTNKFDGTSFTSTGDLNTARRYLASSGTQTASIAAGGYTTTQVAINESFNGSSWTEVNDMNNPRQQHSQTGSSTASLAIGKSPASNIVESWDGTSWTAVSALNNGRQATGAGGTQTYGIAYAGEDSGGTPQGKTEHWDGSTWTEVNDMANARYGAGSLGFSAPANAVLAWGGATSATATEEFTAADFEIKTMTTS